jgi:subtilisin family serine protease
VGDFLPGDAAASPIPGTKGTGQLHNFGTALSPQLYDVITDVGIGVVTLSWADPMGASADDYDLFILNSSGTAVLGSATTVQNGSQNPYEQISGSSIAAGHRVVVVLYSGSPTALYVGNLRGTLSIATSSAIEGHSGNTNALSIAASYWASGLNGLHPFNGASNFVEEFSSDGPRRMFFHPDGSPITPGNTLFATGGGANILKPDVTGADGTTARTSGFSSFFGTSAAAPHIAGIAALIKSAKPSLTGPQIRQMLTTNVWDTMAPGFDRDSGSGIVNAAAAVAAALALP